MDKEQTKRLHDRLTYLEDEISEMYRFLRMRFDGAIEERVPSEVEKARLIDQDRHGPCHD